MDSIDHLANELHKRATMIQTHVPFWAITYHTYNLNPRAAKWYRVSRLIEADGAIFELYWNPDLTLRGKSIADIRAAAKASGINLAPDIYRATQAPRNGNTMERAS